jgi:VanZ family protein
LKNLVKNLGRWTLAFPLAFMGFIFLLSSIPGGRQSVFGHSFELSPNFGNFLHIPVYCTLATLWLIALRAWQVPHRKSLLLAVAYATLYGALDEVHQYFVPDRCMSFMDVLANLLGAIIAILAWRYVQRLFFTAEPS